MHLYSVNIIYNVPQVFFMTSLWSTGLNPMGECVTSNLSCSCLLSSESGQAGQARLPNTTCCPLFVVLLLLLRLKNYYFKMVVWWFCLPCHRWSGLAQQQQQQQQQQSSLFCCCFTYNQGDYLSQGTIYLTVQTYCILLI